MPRMENPSDWAPVPRNSPDSRLPLIIYGGAGVVVFIALALVMGRRPQAPGGEAETIPAPSTAAAQAAAVPAEPPAPEPTAEPPAPEPPAQPLPEPTGEPAGQPAAAPEPVVEAAPEPAPAPATEPASGMSDEELAGGAGGWEEAAVSPREESGRPDIPGLEELGTPPLSMEVETMVGLLSGSPMGYDRAAIKTRYTDPATILSHADDLGLTDDQRDTLTAMAANTLATAREVGAGLVETERAIDAWLRTGGEEREFLDHVRDAAVAESVLRAIHTLARVRASSVLSMAQGKTLDRIMGWEQPSRVSIIPN